MGEEVKMIMTDDGKGRRDGLHLPLVGLGSSSNCPLDFYDGTERRRKREINEDFGREDER